MLTLLSRSPSLFLNLLLQTLLTAYMCENKVNFAKSYVSECASELYVEQEITAPYNV